ncbi:nuclear transport factor 2 family protein [Oxalobacteraceae bacterium OM1]|nr:nuclear transport factor 2 family protein [Oxalobacteraceae bacterium OM1]
MNLDPTLDTIIRYFETLTPESVADIGEVYAANARFKDPFNDVQGIAAIMHLYRHMFTQVDAPCFVVKARMRAGDEAFLTWDLRFRMKRWRRGEQCIHGATWLRLDREGRILEHRDYWDAAEELYEKLPLLGGLMRLLKRRARS